MDEKSSRTDVVATIIDLFFPVFKGIMSQQVYRYLAAGGICFAINFIVFHLSYEYFYLFPSVLYRYLPIHTVSLIASMSITIFVGFYLNKRFVFSGSMLGKKVQFLRYTVSTMLGTLVSIFFMHIFVDYLEWNVTFSFLFNIFIVQMLNFFVQRHFSFSRGEF